MTNVKSAKTEKFQILNKQHASAQVVRPLSTTTAKSAKIEQCQIPTRLLVSARSILMAYAVMWVRSILMVYAVIWVRSILMDFVQKNVQIVI